MRISAPSIFFGIILAVTMILIQVHPIPTRQFDEGKATQSGGERRHQHVASSKAQLSSVLIDVRETIPSVLDLDFERRARELADRDGIDYAVALHQVHELWLLDQPRSGPVFTLSGPAYRIIMRMEDDELISVVSRLPAGSLRGAVIFSSELSDDTYWKLYGVMPESRDRTGLAAQIVANNYHRSGVNHAKQAITGIRDKTDAEAATVSIINSITHNMIMFNKKRLEAKEGELSRFEQSFHNSIEDLGNLQRFAVDHGIVPKVEINRMMDDWDLSDDIRSQLQ